MNQELFILEAIELFEAPFISDNKVWAFPELWKRVGDTDVFNKEISKYFVDEFGGKELSDFLLVTDLRFFEVSKKYKKLALAFAKPSEFKRQSETKFHELNTYYETLEHLVFIGYNVFSYEGSAFTDGLYPAYLDDGITGNVCYDKELIFQLNQFGLIDTLKDSEAICKINNQHPNNDEKCFWYPTAVYVDKYTYSVISKY